MLFSYFVFVFSFHGIQIFLLSLHMLWVPCNIALSHSELWLPGSDQNSKVTAHEHVRSYRRRSPQILSPEHPLRKQNQSWQYNYCYYYNHFLVGFPNWQLTCIWMSLPGASGLGNLTWSFFEEGPVRSRRQRGEYFPEPIQGQLPGPSIPGNDFLFQIHQPRLTSLKLMLFSAQNLISGYVVCVQREETKQIKPCSKSRSYSLLRA